MLIQLSLVHDNAAKCGARRVVFLFLSKHFWLLHYHSDVVIQSRKVKNRAEHWQTKHWLMSLRSGRPVDKGPQEGDYSAWVAWEKGKV